MLETCCLLTSLMKRLGTNQSQPEILKENSNSYWVRWIQELAEDISMQVMKTHGLCSSNIFNSSQISGPVPFTGDSAKDYRDTMAKAKLAVLSCKAGEEVTDAKQLAALKKMADMGSGHNSYGVQSDGFQLLRAYTDPKNYKTNPCDETKKVAWEASTEFTDSQSRYLPWFLLIAKVRQSTNVKIKSVLFRCTDATKCRLQKSRSLIQSGARRRRMPI